MKAIFLVGGPGSGKDHLLRFVTESQSESNLVEIPLDKLYVAITAQSDLPELHESDNIIVNGNAGQIESIATVKAVLEVMHYETAMLYVYTSDEASKARNDARIARGAKTFTEHVRATKYIQSVQAMGHYSEVFGENFWLFNNSHEAGTLTEETKGWIMDLHEEVSEFLVEVSPEITLGPHSKRHGDKLVHINVQKFDHHWSQYPDHYIGHGGSGASISDRYKRVGEFLRHNKTMHASEVYVNQMGHIGFNDGRHRYAYLRDHGHKTIPVAMGPESIAHARKHGYLAKEDTKYNSPDLMSENYSATAVDNSRGNINVTPNGSPTENPATVMAKVLKPKKNKTEGDTQGGIRVPDMNRADPPVAEERKTDDGQAIEMPTQKRKIKLTKPKDDSKATGAAPPPNFFDGRMGMVPSGSLGLTSDYKPTGKPLSELRKRMRK